MSMYSGKAVLFGTLKNGHIQIYEIFKDDVSTGVFHRWIMRDGVEHNDFLVGFSEETAFDLEIGYNDLTAALAAC
jgi:hypothetical protein